MKKSLAALLVLCGCDPVRLADFSLVVREPEGNTRIQEDLGIDWFIDDRPPEGQTLNEGFAGPTIPFKVEGTGNHEIELVAFSGERDAPAAIGRSGVLLLEGSASIEPAERDDPREVRVPMLLSATNDIELLDSTRPNARIGASVCSDGKGAAWLFGGVDEGGAIVAPGGYYFSRQDLVMNEAVGVQINGQTACDALDGRFYLFNGNCNAGDEQPVGGGAIFQGVDDVEPGFDNVGNNVVGCDPVLNVTESFLWLGVRDRVALYTLDGIQNLGTTPNGAFRRQRYNIVPRGNDELLIGGGFFDDGSGEARAAGVDVVRRDGAAALSITPLDEFEEHTFVAMLVFNGKPMGLNTEGGLVDLSEDIRDRTIDMFPAGFAATVTDAIPVVVRDVERVVAIGGAQIAVSEPGNIAEPVELDRAREKLAVTFGGAVLVVGGSAGVDVFQAPP